MSDLSHRGGHRRPHHHREPGHRYGPGFGPASLIRELFEPRRGGRPSVRRGDVRLAILSALRDRPMHGYQVIQELEVQTQGRWRPSAGSVYPTLQQLEDEGLVTSDPVDGRRTYALTDEGRKATTDLPAGRGPWADAEGGESTDLRRLALQVVSASLQVSRIGSPESRRQAAAILVETRRRIYGLLAEDTGDEAAPAETTGPTA